MDREQRQMVEKIKSASSIKIETGMGEFSLEFDSRRHNTKKLFHDIGIAIQDYFVKNS